MRTLTLAETKMHLSAVVDRVQAGEEVVITRRGRRVARIVPDFDLQQDDAARILNELRAFVMSQPEQPRSASDIVRGLRDEARY